MRSGVGGQPIEDADLGEYEPPAVTVLGTVADLTQADVVPGTELFDDGSQQ